MKVHDFLIGLSFYTCAWLLFDSDYDTRAALAFSIAYGATVTMRLESWWFNILAMILFYLVLWKLFIEIPLLPN